MQVVKRQLISRFENSRCTVTARIFCTLFVVAGKNENVQFIDRGILDGRMKIVL